MSSWGIFPKAKSLDGRAHIAPVDDEARILAPHELSAKCPCEPGIYERGYLVRHHDPERGGTRNYLELTCQ